MTKAERAALRALEAKATPGPWGAEFSSTDEMEGEEYIYSTTAAPEGTRTVVGCGWYDGPHLLLREADADVIAAARNSLVALLDALDDAEAVIGAAQAMFLCGGADHAKAFAVALDAYAAKHGGGE